MEGKIEEERKKEERKKKERRKKEEELSGPCNSAPHLFHVLGGGIYKVIINRG
jgi:hypothetical protein